MGTVFFGNAGPQDPMFGISRSRIAKRLTRRNWKEKAVCRTDGSLTYYVWIAYGTLIKGEDRQQGYQVNVRTFPRVTPPFECSRFYPTLEEALAHASGEDGSEFARGTRPVGSGKQPAERHAPIIVGRFYRL